MRRRLLNLMTALSLLLCVAVCARWPRSYFIPDGWPYTTARATIWSVRSGRGQLEVIYATSDLSAFVESEDSLAFEKPAVGF